MRTSSRPGFLDSTHAMIATIAAVRQRHPETMVASVSFSVK
jgi:hypothetical protein